MSCTLLLAFALIPAAEVQAQGGKPPTEASFALVLGNNRSLTAAQPDLHYADDDAVKYALLFSAIAGPERVHTLTRLDRATTDLHGGGVSLSGPPTKAAISAAVASLRVQIAAARQAGQRSTLYFVFAGHGQEERGRGYLELEDGRFYREDLVNIVQAAAPDRAHLLLDSCNSFFVVHPRRPGGKAWTTSNEITDKLEVAGTDVGVFLSTSAEAQVYEWSQLQSGVFSHAVRSALMGAADADGDRRVTYRELDAFVTTASSGIQNSLYRPHLYARSPEQTEVFIDLSPVDQTFTLKGFGGRVTIRDQRGVRLADVHPEQGFTPMLLRWPGAELSVIAEQSTDEGRIQLFETELGDAVSVSPPLASAAGVARGSDTLFAQYFRVPFGPGALNAYQALELDAAPKVFGLTKQQASRFESQLSLMAKESRKQHVTQSMIGMLVGMSGGTLVTLPLMLAADQITARSDDADRLEAGERLRSAGGGISIPFACLTLLSLFNLTQSSSGEQIYADYKNRYKSAGLPRATRVALAAERLADQAEANADVRRAKTIGFGSTAIATALIGSGSLLAADIGEEAGQDLASLRIVGAVGIASAVVLGGVALNEWFNPTPEETFLEVMRRDPESVLRAE